LIANLKKPTNIKEWNDFSSMMLSAIPGIMIDSVEERSMQKQLELIKNRRVKGRLINGSAELYLKVPEEHRQKQRLIEIMDDIENTELSIIEVQRLEDKRPSEKRPIIEVTRKKQLLTNELKLRINRLTEEYDEIMRILPVKELQ